MEINEYQKKAHTFADYVKPMTNDADCGYCYPVIGLTEEAGEVAGKFGKAIRDCNGIINDERKTEIVKELGDVTWFVAELCTVLDVTLEEVMQKNIDKLTSRKERNVIHGNGDNR